jgi:glycosyltransferase involved in cell wall biosynthesis
VPDIPTELWSNAEPVIGSVGRFVRQKDFGLLLDVVMELRSRGHMVRGCIVGDGPEMQEIKKKVVALDLENVIELPGMVTETDHWFRYFDIYAITSTEEGLPVSMLEAMSYGLPVVASDVGAISSAIRSAEEGSVVPSGNRDSFVDAIAAYLDNRDLATQIGARARNRVVSEFSIEAISAGYKADYQAILERKNTVKRLSSQS